MLIRYYGHVGAPSGYGSAANEICMAILTIPGIRLEISTNGSMLGARHRALLACIKDDADLTDDPDVVVIHTLPLSCVSLLNQLDIRRKCPRAKCIAYTTWEGVRMSEDVANQLDAFDAVWMPGFANAVTHPRYYTDGRRVAAVPHAYDSELAPLPRSRDRFFRFYYIGAWNRRKNPEGVLQAYMSEFGPNDDVELVMQCSGAPSDVCTIAKIATGLQTDEMPAVVFSNARASDEQIALLHAQCDVFVTASRGEAWNIPAFDAMVNGRHIITPRLLGSDEYLSGTSAARYSSRESPAGGEVRLISTSADGMGRAQYVGGQGLTAKTQWREPSIRKLAQTMRRAYVFGTNEIRIKYDPAERYGRVAVGTIISRLLERMTR